MDKKEQNFRQKITNKFIYKYDIYVVYIIQFMSRHMPLHYKTNQIKPVSRI